MSHRLAALLPLLLARRRAVFALAALFGLAMLPGVARLASDNSPEVFFLEGTPDLARYREFVKSFGSDEGVRLVVEGPALWSEEGLEWLGRLEEEAARLPGVAAVSGLATRERRFGWPPLEPEAFRASLREDALARALGWVDREARLATVLVVAEPGGAETQHPLYQALDRLLADPPSGLSAWKLGSRSLDAALDASSREIQRVYFPLLVLFAALLLYATFRELQGVAVPIAFVAVGELALLGSMGYAGVRLNLILAILPPLLFTIALATAVHLQVRCRDFEAAGLDAVAATVATYADKGRAVLWTGLSTATGFASLAASPVAPIRDLGLWAGFGLGGLVIAAFTLYPCLLAVTTGNRRELPERRFELALQARGRRWASAAARHRRAVLLFYGVTALAAAAGLPRLALESNALHYLASDHPVRAGSERLKASGIGLSTVELLLELPSERAGELRSVEGLARLSRLAGELSALPHVLGVLSAGDLVDDAVRRSPLARLGGEAAARAPTYEALLADPQGRLALARLLSEDGRRARLTIFCETLGVAAISPLRERALARAREAFPAAQVSPTGQFLLLLDMQRYLLGTLGRSLGLTLPVLTLTFWLLLRRAGLVVKALVPNLWPVLAIFGAMGWLGVPLDIATVMVASISLGLAVDDTIHTLSHYREDQPRLGGGEAVVSRVEKTAPAYLLTGLILIAGFGVCALSDFEPTARFGLLSASAIAIALFADLLLVPALFGDSHPVTATE